MTLTAKLSDEDIDRIAEAVAAKLKAASRKTYNLEQAAEALNLSTWTVRRMVDDGKLKRIPGTGRLIFSATEIDKLINHGS